MKYTPHYSSFYLSNLIGIPLTTDYAKAAKEKKGRELSDSLYSALTSVLASEKEKFLEPVVIFHNEIVEYDAFRNIVRNEHTNIPDDTKIRQFYVSLGIFDLYPKSATATITKNGKLELTWTERAGKGKFNTLIPPYLVVTSAPVLSYEGGVLDICVNVKSRSENEAVFVGKLESK